MDIKITPTKLSGSVQIPPSKSVAHRMIISAALAKGRSVISNLYPSVDILATIDCMKQLGAKIELDGDVAIIYGIDKLPGRNTLYDGITRTFGKFPEWTFSDHPSADEVMRRKNVLKRFFECLYQDKIERFGRFRRRPLPPVFLKKHLFHPNSR